MTICFEILLKFRSLMLALLIVLYLSGTAAATTWQSIGPYGGDAKAIVVDYSSNHQIVYAGTNAGIYKSTNSGASWNSVNTGLSFVGTVYALAIDPINPQILYTSVQGGSGGILYKSIDGGKNWVIIDAGIILANLKYVDCLAIDISNPQVIYAGSNGSGVFKTIDGGDNWVAVNTGLTSADVRTIAIDPSTPKTVYAGTVDGGVYKSTNGGTNWSAINTGLTGINLYISSLVIDPKNPQTIYAGSYGVFKTSNGGDTWISMKSGLPNFSVGYLAIDPNTPQTIYAGMNNGSVYKTTNGGTAWNSYSIGLKSTAVRFLAIDSGATQIIYLGTNVGVFKTVDGSSNWNTTNGGFDTTNVLSMAIDPLFPQTIYAGLDSGVVFKSINGGSNWDFAMNGLTAPAIRALAIDPNVPHAIYAGAAGGVFKSSNGGTSWSQINTGLSNTIIYCIAINPTSSDIYAGTGGGVFKSTDGGANWNSSNAGITNLTITALVIDRSDPRIIYAGTNGGGIFKTTDGGTNWNVFNSGMTSLLIKSIVIDPTTNPQTIYVATNGGGIFKSTDGGTSWNAFNTGLYNIIVYFLAVDSNTPPQIYAGTNSGLQYLTSGDSNWKFVDNWSSGSVSSIVIDPITPQTIYAGTSRKGVFKSITSSTPTIIVPASTTFYTGISGSLTVSATGWPSPTLSVSGTLPDGFTFDPLTGILSTTGPTINVIGQHTIQFTASNGTPPDATKAVMVTVVPNSNLTVTIDTPPDNSLLTNYPITISGTASGDGLASVNIQATDGTYYLQSDNSLSTTAVWLPTTGTPSSWSRTVNTNAKWVGGIPYTITARADSNNSSRYATSTFKIKPSVTKKVTVLSSAFASNSIRAGETTTMTGSLLLTDNTPLTSRTIKVIITPPSTLSDSNPAPIINTFTTDPAGNFSSGSLLPIFAEPGIYAVQARFEGDPSNQATALSLSLPVVAKSGYAIIVVGKSNDSNLLSEHNATATSIFNTLTLKRGFQYSYSNSAASNIQLVTSTSGSAITKQQIQTALDRIRAQYVISPAPVYLIMIDHGSSGAQGGFVMGSETLTPAELGTMLNNFESGIDAGTLAANKRFLVVGTCYSGLFQSLSTPGRVIITSSAATEQSLAGANTFSGNTASLSGGDYFIDNLFSFLGRGDNFNSAFTQARTAVALRDPRKVALALHSGVVDTLAQHPLLDANGDGIANYDLEGSADGVESEGFYLGEGVRVPAGGNPTDITGTLPTTILGSTDSTQTIWMTVNDSSRVDRAWIEIRTPGITPTGTGTGQFIASNLIPMPLIYDGQKWVGDYSSFTTAGKYDIYYYARDNQTGDTSPMAHSAVYKKIASNPVQPSAFTLSTPADLAQVNPPVLFTWQESIDANGLTYTLQVASNSADFNNSIVYQADNLLMPSVIVYDSSFKNPASPGNYYCQVNPCSWRVRAIDSFGEEKYSDTRSFTIVKTNIDTPVFVKAVVTSNGLAVSLASCTVQPGNVTVYSISDGTCLASIVGIPVSVDVAANYFVPQSSIALPAPEKGVSKLPAPVALTANTLTTSISGSGSGSVNCLSAADGPIACSGPVKYNDSVTLSALPDWKSLLVWGGSACSGSISPCLVRMDGPKNVTASFNANLQAIIVGGIEYASLQEALNNASNGATVKSKVYSFLESVLFNRPGVTVIIDGGKGLNYIDQPGGVTTIDKDYFRIQQGTLKIKGPLAVK